MSILGRLNIFGKVSELQRRLGKLWLRLLAAIAIRHPKLYHDAHQRAEAQASLAGINAIPSTTLEVDELLSLTEERLRRRVEELSGLYRVGQKLNRTLNIDDTLYAVLEEARRATNADYGNVSLRQLGPDRLVARVGLGWPESVNARFRDEGLPDQMGVQGRVLRTGKPALIDDVDQDPDYISAVEDTRSEVAVPIRYAGDVVGVMNLESRQVRAFNAEQLRYLGALADQAAIAIGNAQAFEEQQLARRRANRRAMQLTRIAEISRSFRTDQPLEATLEDIAYAIQEVADFNIVLFSVVEDDLLRRVAAAGMPLVEFERARQLPVSLSTVDRFVKDEYRISHSYFIPAGQSELWMDLDYYDFRPPAVDRPDHSEDDAWQIQDALLSPLHGSDNQIIGMLSVDQPLDGKRPSRPRIETLEIFANQAATAIENAKLYQEANRRASLLRLSSQIGRRFSAILDPDELLAEVVDLIRDAFGYSQVFIYELDEGAGVLTLRSGTGEAASARTATGPQLEPDSKTVVGWVAAHSEPKLVNNLQESADFKPNPHGLNSASELAIGLRNGDHNWGVLDVHSDRKLAFSDDDVFVLQTLSDQLAIALENSRLFDDSLRRERLSSALGQAGLTLLSSLKPQEVLDLVCHEALKVFEVHGVFLWLLEGDELVRAAAAGHKAAAFIGLRIALADNILGARIVRQRQAEFVNGVDFSEDKVSFSLARRLDAKSILGAPLIFGEQTLGALMFVDCQNPVRFDPNDKSVVTLLANQAAAAIQNARLFEARERQVQQLAALAQVSRALQRAIDLDEVLNLVLESVFEMVGKEQGFIMLHDAQTQTLKVAQTRNIPDSLLQILNESNVPASTDPFAAVIESQQIMEVEERSPVDTTGINFPPVTNQVTYVPMKAERGVIGILAIEDIITEDTTKGVVQTLADLAAIAIDRARLFEERERRITELAILNETGQALGATLQLDKLLDLIYHQINQVIDASEFFVAFYDEQRGVVSFPFYVDSRNEVWHERQAGNGLTEHVIKTRRPLILQGDLAGQMAALGIEEIGTPCQAWMGVPMIAGDEVLGVIAVQNYEAADDYTQNDLNLLQTMAFQAAVAIENTILLKAARARADEMQQLYDLGVTVSSTLDVREVLRVVVAEACRLTNTDLASIYLWDEELQDFIVEVVADTPQRQAQLAELPPRKDGLSRHILEIASPLVVTDTSKDDRISSQVLAAEIASFVAVPILVQGQSTGLIFVSSLTPREFGQHEVRLLSFVANQAAVAIRNAQLTERRERFAEELERRVEERTVALASTLKELTVERDRVGTLYSITKELSTSLDLDRVLMEALGLINRAVGVSSGSILMVDSESEYLVLRAALKRKVPLPRGGLKTRYKLGVGLAGKVMEEREARIVYDVERDADWLPSDVEIPGRRSALVVPLVTGEDVLGVLMLYHSEPGYFDLDQLKLVSAAAAQVATAINNAELYNLITEQAARLGVLLRNVQAEANKNQAIVAGIADGVIVLDGDQQIVLINPAAGRVLGLDPKEVTDRSLAEIIDRPQQHLDKQLVRSLVEYVNALGNQVDEGVTPFETRLVAAEKVVVLSVAPVVLSSGAVPSLVTVLRDVSREAEIERIKNEFISTVSHELRTPMTSIKGYTDLLTSGKAGELSDVQHKFIQVVKANADRLTALVNDILDISRMETGRIRLDIQPLEIIELIREVGLAFEAQMLEKGISLMLDLPPALPPVGADRARLMQILVNLVSNAWKYTLPGGTVTLRAVLRGEFIQLEVNDTGIGLSEADLERVFDRFYRVERSEVLLADGTGLGLSIVKMFVEMLGGEIWVQSEIDVGSTFCFTLPLVKEEVETAPKVDRLASNEGRQRILVTDDDADNRHHG
jgi:PAS domain S-box-containing protein